MKCIRRLHSIKCRAPQSVSQGQCESFKPLVLSVSISNSKQRKAKTKNPTMNLFGWMNGKQNITCIQVGAFPSLSQNLKYINQPTPPPTNHIIAWLFYVGC